jgi:hypothetical protein
MAAAMSLENYSFVSKSIFNKSRLKSVQIYDISSYYSEKRVAQVLKSELKQSKSPTKRYLCSPKHHQMHRQTTGDDRF